MVLEAFLASVKNKLRHILVTDGSEIYLLKKKTCILLVIFHKAFFYNMECWLEMTYALLAYVLVLPT